MNRFLIYLMITLFSSLCFADSYDYPVKDPFAATIIGTPSEYKASLPESVPHEEREVTVFPDRAVAEFIARKEFRYSLASQEKAAPLIFVIAGTGVSYKGESMRMLEKAFYQAGFHVVLLSSPTFANFIVTASTTQIPGNIVDDSADLYHLMGLIKAQISDQVDVTEYHLTGYSLGGAQAAYVAKLDGERAAFNFKKVLMINPPVSQYNSASILDEMLDSIPGGRNKYNDFYNELMAELSSVYSVQDSLDFSDDPLYRIYQGKNGDVNQSRLAALIGVAFRLSGANMIFTSDLVTNGGYIIPKNHVVQKTESTTGYFKVATRISFLQYFEERLLPAFQKQNPGMAKKDLLNQLSLAGISSYLRSANNIAVVHNEDDIILAPKEIDFFRDVFRTRAHIYPTGGHLGNMAYKDNVDYMINYFKN